MTNRFRLNPIVAIFKLKAKGRREMAQIALCNGLRHAKMQIVSTSFETSRGKNMLELQLTLKKAITRTI